jgi:hypothetical protein
VLEQPADGNTVRIGQVQRAPSRRIVINRPRR